MTRRMTVPIRTVTLFLAMCPMSFAQGTPPVADFSIDSDEVDAAGRLRTEIREGYLPLSWSAGEGNTIYHLQSDSSDAFSCPVSRYSGPNTTSFISGLAEGDYFFRVRARSDLSSTWGPWSQTLIVPVRHHSMTTAWWLFGLGAGIFGLTVLFIAVNANRSAVSEAIDA